MANNKRSKTGKATAVGQLITGAGKHFVATQNVTIEGNPMTIAQAMAKMQILVTNRANVVAAQATAKTQVANERAQMPALDAFIEAFESFVRVSFGTQPDVLADFGMEPPKAPTPLTAEQKAVAAAKRKATREARGTAGSKQKKNVKGNVTAQLVVTPAPTPAPAAQPAAPAANEPAAAPNGANATPAPGHTGS